ncbi:MAG: hypothetical protein ACI9FJ_003382, partial [Alteromonadaceae bacterium]
HYDQLNLQMQAALSGTEIKQLHQLVGGHPYLTRLAFYQLSKDNAPDFNRFMNTAADEQGPFGSHLRGLMAQLYRREELLIALRKLIKGNDKIDDDLYYRLYGAGLVYRVERKVKPANVLYARFFKGVL